LRYIEAVPFGLITFAALSAMPFYPLWLVVALALIVGAVAISSAPLAALAMVAALALPVLAADFVVGVLFLVIGFSATQYLATDRALGFLVVALAVAAVPLHAEWAVCVLAGYLLGRGRGAVAAVLACVGIEVVGLLLGSPSLGTVATGGTAPGLFAFSAAPAGALGFSWLPDAIAAADPGRVLDVFARATDVPLLVVQPIAWAAAAVVGGAFTRPRPNFRALAAAVGGIAVLALSGALLAFAFTTPVDPSTYVTTAAISLAVALVVVAAGEWVFPVAAPTPAATSETPASSVAAESLRGVRAEDADVDDLLRLIASAEDELATRHRTHAFVLITDMKSFSAMTEEVGSIESAKLVQRHRDLLIPVIERHGGKGKPTGGDGLVAAFASPTDALAAAVDMQQTLEQVARGDTGTLELVVRVGVAEGEVVLDKGGRPFLGAALNLAARVMDLADGGRIMTIGSVAAAAELPDPSLHPHGDFKLKNIAEPIPVVEVLWRDDLEPQQIRAT
jgi:class 3 adenylate cyclase